MCSKNSSYMQLLATDNCGNLRVQGDFYVSVRNGKSESRRIWPSTAVTNNTIMSNKQLHIQISEITAHCSAIASRNYQLS